MDPITETYRLRMRLDSQPSEAAASVHKIHPDGRVLTSVSSPRNCGGYWYLVELPKGANTLGFETAGICDPPPPPRRTLRDRLPQIRLARPRLATMMVLAAFIAPPEWTMRAIETVREAAQMLWKAVA